MLSLTNLAVSYDGSRIFRGVSRDVAPGTSMCLMGRNGGGKTTTAKATIGLPKIDDGSVKLGAVDLTGWKPDGRARAGLGYVPQGRDIFPNLTVWGKPPHRGHRPGAQAQWRGGPRDDVVSHSQGDAPAQGRRAQAGDGRRDHGLRITVQ